MKKISCIIPAYNEEKRIGAVLNTVKNHPLLDEIIVVNDGSVDNTKKIIEENLNHKLRLISFEENHGKSFVVAAGMENSKNDFIFMLDADLVGLTEKNITELIQPILSNAADMSITLRKNSLPIMRLIKLDFVSGERIFPKELIANHINTIRNLPCFGIESFLNKLVIKNSLKIKVVFWKNVMTPRKSKKIGYWKGLKADLRMIRHILKITSARDIISINLKLIKLKVK